MKPTRRHAGRHKPVRRYVRTETGGMRIVQDIPMRRSPEPRRKRNDREELMDTLVKVASGAIMAALGYMCLSIFFLQ